MNAKQWGMQSHRQRNKSKIVNDELTDPRVENTKIFTATTPPTVIMMAGLKSGKQLLLVLAALKKMTIRNPCW